MTRLVFRHGFEKDLMRQQEMIDGMRRAGRRIQAEAERIAPRLPALPEGRERFYADMFDTTAGVDEHGALAAVNNRHFIALFVEFGTVNNRPHAVLRRAMDANRGKAL